MKSIHEVKVNLVGIRLSVDSDHLRLVGLNCLTEELPVVVNNFLAQACIGPYFIAALLLTSVFRVQEGTRFRVNRPGSKLLHHRRVRLFEDNHQLGQELQIVQLLDLVDVHGASVQDPAINAAVSLGETFADEVDDHVIGH